MDAIPFGDAEHFCMKRAIFSDPSRVEEKLRIASAMDWAPWVVEVALWNISPRPAAPSFVYETFTRARFKA